MLSARTKRVTALKIIVTAAILTVGAGLSAGTARADGSDPVSDPTLDVEGTGRLHTVTWNACDNQGQGQAICETATSHQRAVYIENTMLDPYGPQVGMFQEICKYTYNQALGYLGSGWHGTFDSLALTPYGAMVIISGAWR